MIVLDRSAYDDIGIRFDRPTMKLFYHLAIVYIVGVEQHKILARGEIDSPIARQRRSSVVLGIYGNTFIACRILFENLQRSVFRPVVDAYDFEIAIRLGQNSIHGFTQT